MNSFPATNANFFSLIGDRNPYSIEASSVLRLTLNDLGPSGTAYAAKLMSQIVHAVENDLILRFHLISTIKMDMQHIFSTSTVTDIEKEIVKKIFGPDFTFDEGEIHGWQSYLLYSRVNSGPYEGWYVRCEKQSHRKDLSFYLFECQPDFHVAAGVQTTTVKETMTVDEATSTMNHLMRKALESEYGIERCQAVDKLFHFCLDYTDLIHSVGLYQEKILGSYL